jgi:hypothetical protein
MHSDIVLLCTSRMLPRTWRDERCTTATAVRRDDAKARTHYNADVARREEMKLPSQQE